MRQQRFDPFPAGVIIAGSGIYAQCAQCGKLVKLNKWLVGSLHICAGREDDG